MLSDPISVLHQLEQRGDLVFTTANPLSVKLNCCAITSSADGYATKRQKAESYSTVLSQLEGVGHSVIDSPPARLVCPNKIMPCEFCSDPKPSELTGHITRRMPKVNSICGISALCEVSHYWTNGSEHFAVGSLCCNQSFSLRCPSKACLYAAFETFLEASDHFIKTDGVSGLHVRLHSSISSCPLCDRKL